MNALETKFAEILSTVPERLIVPTWGGPQAPTATEQDDAVPMRRRFAMRYPEWHAHLAGSTRSA